MSRITPYLQAAPLALVFPLFFILPIGLVIVVSFFNYESHQILIPDFTFQNYQDGAASRAKKGS